MPPKKTINLAIPEQLLEEFNEVCKHYGHAKQKGLVLSAAILTFLEADPVEQGNALERILIADIRSGVDTLIERAKAEQAHRIQTRQTDEPAGPGQSHTQPTMRQAAKKAGEARKSLGKLPRPKDDSR